MVDALFVSKLLESSLFGMARTLSSFLPLSPLARGTPRLSRQGSRVTEVFNRISEKPVRQSLRKALPAAELILWSKLKSRQVNGWKFRRQFGVGPYVVDFYCPALKLAIEIDGDSTFDQASMRGMRRGSS
jgi:hypothetical protein